MHYKSPLEVDKEKREMIFQKLYFFKGIKYFQFLYYYFFIGLGVVNLLEYPNLFPIKNIINKMTAFKIYINIQYFY